MTQENTVEQVVETPPAPVEDINTLKERLTKAEAALAEKSKGFVSLQQSLTQKDTELRKQTDLRNDIASIRQAVADQNAIIELQAAAIALGREGDEDELAKVHTLLRTKVAEQENARKQEISRRQQEQSALANQEYNQKADALFAQAQTLFQGEDLQDIEDLLKSGNLVLAQREIRLANKSKTPVKVEPNKETDEEKIARGVREQLARDYPDLYKTDTGSPGGGTRLTTTEAAEKYNKGEISYEEAQKHGVKYD